MVVQLAHTFLDDEAHMSEQNGKHFEAINGKSMAQDSALKDSRRLPDKPGKYNPPAPAGVVRPKPVVVPKAR